jgi:serine/threonine-protein kinase
VFTPSNQTGLVQVAAAGGTPQPLTELDKKAGEISHRWPELLPNGKGVVFVAGVSPEWDESNLVVQLLDTGERRVLIKGGTSPRYLASGHLAYARANTLMAVRFDLETMTVLGTPVPVVEGVWDPPEGSSAFDTSSAGSLAYVSGTTANRSLVWVNRRGEQEAISAPPRSYEAPRISPDGRQIAVGTGNRPVRIWMQDLSTGRQAQLPFEGLTSQFPVWTHDGKRILYRNTWEGTRNIYWRAVDGSGPEDRLTTGDHIQSPQAITPDGKLLAYVDIDPLTSQDIWILPLDGERKPRPFVRTRFQEISAAFSPDGQWLAYASNESGRFEVYVQPFPGPGGKWQISSDGGQEAAWNPRGGELFYRSGAKMMAVQAAIEPTFRAGTPQLLFEEQYVSRGGTRSYDVARDGQRFLMIKPGEQDGGATQINVVLNWHQELLQKVPVK